MGLKAVLFDFGGTLDANGISWINRFYPLYLQAGLQIPWTDFCRAFYACDDTLPGRFILEGLDLEQTVTRQTYCVLDRIAPQRRDLAARIVAPFVKQSRESLRQNRPILENLRRNYRLGILSNFYGNLESLLAIENFLELFDVVADSGKIGSIKPDSRIFLHAIRRLGVEPSEILMVGDSLQRDMKGAENLGMPHAWLIGRQNCSPCCPQVLALTSLSHLEQVL